MNNREGAIRYKRRKTRIKIVQHPRQKYNVTFASSKVSRSVFSDSPDIPETIEGAETEMNGTPNS